MKESKGYKNIDGLKAIAALGIVAVHVAKNVEYQFDSFFYTDILCRMESFVNLFLLLVDLECSMVITKRLNIVK